MAQAALVVGASGATGAPLCEELLRQGWKVYAISRRSPDLRNLAHAPQLNHLPLDLTDTRQVRETLARCGDITHVFYCANAATQDLRQAMIEQLLDALAPLPDFERINFIQGMKYYGCHLGPFRTPARETDPRVPGCDFYYTEEDMLIRRQQGAPWSWTVLRPHAVCGNSRGNPLNIASALAVYGSIQRELAAPLHFPGTQQGFESLFQVVDARLLARAAIHVSTTEQCRNTAFNIHNGAWFRWSELWPALADAFSLQPAAPDNTHPADYFSGHEETWRRMTEKYRLRPFPYERLPRWALGEYSRPNGRISCEYDICADTSRLHSTGFTEGVGNADMFLNIIQELRKESVIP